tara:strand:- start:1237 stop:1425 length:189 start_codon:yes stop_codon:yes gene_type:complete
MPKYIRTNLDGVNIFIDLNTINYCEACGYNGYVYGEYGESLVLADEAEVVCPKCYSSQYYCG